MLSPTEWPFPIKDVASFGEFLEHVGVRSGLWPMPLSREPIELDGHQYAPVTVAELFGLDEPMRSQWVDHVNVRWRGYSEPLTPTPRIAVTQRSGSFPDKTATRRWMVQLEDGLPPS